MSSSANLHQTLQQAISFLTTPLAKTSVSLQSINILQRALFSALHARYITGPWDLSNPQSGSESRAIRLSATNTPPSFILRACDAAAVNWTEWLFLLGGGLGLDLDLYIDPGRVNVCFRKPGSPSSGLVTVWQLQPPQPEVRKLTTKELLAHDNDDDLFVLISQKVHSPSWVASWTTNAPPSPIPAELRASGPDASWGSSGFLAVPKMSAPPRPTSNTSSHSSGHSRSSSYSSAFSSSGSSSYASSSASGSPPRTTYSIDDVSDWRRPHAVAPAPVTSKPAAEPKADKANKQRRTRAAPVVVEASKATVTPYDGGKTTVMSGGVLLGAVPRRGRN